MANNCRVSLTLVLLLSIVSVEATSGGDVEIDFNNPVRSAKDDEIVDLPGLSFKPNFKHYSGYLSADNESDRFLHYWFVESQSQKPLADPLVLWLNGGPGCSSLLGLLTELGPFRVAPNSSIVENQFAWNKNANVLFLESPAGVGFSYAAHGSRAENDDTTAMQNHLALRSFFEKFPQYKKNDLYLTGESYGGVYLPTLGVLVDQDNELNLKGVAIGNGYLDATKLAEALVYFSYYHGLVGRSTWDGISKYCCNGNVPARGQCEIVGSKNTKCAHYVGTATDAIINSGVNPYNLYDQCQSGDNNNNNNNEQEFKQLIKNTNYHSHREYFDKQLILSAFKTNQTRLNRRYLPVKKNNNMIKLVNKQHASSYNSDPPCTDDSITIDYLNQADVKKALHIPENLKQLFTTCADKLDYTMIYPARPDGLAPQMNQLINSKRNLTLLVYNGDVDLMCNFFGDEWFVDDLGREVIQDYSPWLTNGQISGFSKYYKGIAYFTVKGSGHMVPTDKPAEALNMFEQFLDGLHPDSADSI